MIFAPTLSVAGFLLLIILPALSIPLTIVLAGVLLVRWSRVGRGAATKPLSRKARGWCRGLVVFTILLDLWSAFLFYHAARIDRETRDRLSVKATRENFILDRDFLYGELLVPNGSQIHRYDPFDNGEPDLPLRLRGLRAVRFPQPVEVARVWARAMEVNGKIELARDQVIGPLFTYNQQGVLVRDGGRPSVACKRGQIARFNVPIIEYDSVAEFASPEPDGPAARFKPSQWQFLGCEDSGPIALPSPSRR